MTYLGTIEVDNTVTVNNNQTFVCNGGNVQANFPSQFTRFEEFKLRKIQFVIVPRTVGQNQSTYVTDAIQMPYLLIREGDPGDAGAPSITYADALQTPGYRYVHILKKSRTVFNVGPGMTINETAREFGSTATIARRSSIGWLKTDVASIGFDQAQLEVLRPRLTLGSDPLLYDVYVYVTCYFRGNITELTPD